MSRDTVEPAFPEQAPEAFSRTVFSHGGASIAYDVYDRPSSTIVVIVPGFWRDRRFETIRHIALFLNQLQLAVAVTDLRGHGESGGRFGFNRFEHEDVAAVSRDLLGTGRYDSIVLLGLSMGGAIATTTASRHDLPIAGLILISPVSRVSGVIPRPNPFTIHRHLSLRQILRAPRVALGNFHEAHIDVIEAISRVTAPVCLIHVKHDWLVHHSHSQALYDAANEPKELHLLDLPGRSHADRLFKVHGEYVEPIIEAFLRKVQNNVAKR